MKKVEELIKFALVGTDRLDPIIAFEDDLEELKSSFEEIAQEEKLLKASAIFFKYNLAGKVPEKLDGIELTKAETETLENVDNKLVNILNNIFYQHPFLLTEFLTNLIKTNKVLPHKLLPKVLEEGAKDKNIQDLLIKTASKRALWLAKQNTRWSYLFDERKGANFIWSTETTQARVNFLLELRKKEPEKALEFLNSTWKEEAAKDKVRFLETLSTNLSEKDEEFLEQAVDDKRSKEVRKKALELLEHIPSAKIIERMTARFDKLFEIESKSKKLVLNINVIDNPDKDLLRDIGGEVIELKTYEEKLNFVLVNILEKVPLKYFVEKLQKEPKEIIELINKSKNNYIFDHLSKQAFKEKNTEWVKELITYSKFDYLLPVLEASEKEDFLLKRLNQSVEKNYGLLNYHTTAWSEKFSYQVIEIITNDYREKKSTLKSNYYAPLYTLLFHNNYVTRFNYNLVEKIREHILPVFSTDSQEYNKTLEFLNVLQFRHDMLKEFEIDV
jgi:hypothetical protein